MAVEVLEAEVSLGQSESYALLRTSSCAQSTFLPTQKDKEWVCDEYGGA